MGGWVLLELTRAPNDPAPPPPPPHPGFLKQWPGRDCWALSLSAPKYGAPPDGPPCLGAAFPPPSQRPLEPSQSPRFILQKVKELKAFLNLGPDETDLVLDMDLEKFCERCVGIRAPALGHGWTRVTWSSVNAHRS